MLPAVHNVDDGASGAPPLLQHAPEQGGTSLLAPSAAPATPQGTFVDIVEGFLSASKNEAARARLAITAASVSRVHSTLCQVPRRAVSAATRVQGRQLDSARVSRSPTWEPGWRRQVHVRHVTSTCCSGHPTRTLVPMLWSIVSCDGTSRLRHQARQYPHIGQARPYMFGFVLGVTKKP